MSVRLCDACAPEGCEPLAKDIEEHPPRCAMCDLPGVGRLAFDLNALKEHWFNEGHGCGSNAMIGACG